MFYRRAVAADSRNALILREFEAYFDAYEKFGFDYREPPTHQIRHPTTTINWTLGLPESGPEGHDYSTGAPTVETGSLISKARNAYHERKGEEAATAGTVQPLMSRKGKRAMAGAASPKRRTHRQPVVAASASMGPGEMPPDEMGSVAPPLEAPGAEMSLVPYSKDGNTGSRVGFENHEGFVSRVTGYYAGSVGSSVQRGLTAPSDPAGQFSLANAGGSVQSFMQGRERYKQPPLFGEVMGNDPSSSLLAEMRQTTLATKRFDSLTAHFKAVGRRPEDFEREAAARIANDPLGAEEAKALDELDDRIRSLQTRVDILGRARGEDGDDFALAGSSAARDAGEVKHLEYQIESLKVARAACRERFAKLRFNRDEIRKRTVVDSVTVEAGMEAARKAAEAMEMRGMAPVGAGAAYREMEVIDADLKQADAVRQARHREAIERGRRQHETRKRAVGMGATSGTLFPDNGGSVRSGGVPGLDGVSGEVYAGSRGQMGSRGLAIDPSEVGTVVDGPEFDAHGNPVEGVSNMPDDEELMQQDKKKFEPGDTRLDMTGKLITGHVVATSQVVTPRTAARMMAGEGHVLKTKAQVEEEGEGAQEQRRVAELRGKAAPGSNQLSQAVVQEEDKVISKWGGDVGSMASMKRGDGTLQTETLPVPGTEAIALDMGGVKQPGLARQQKKRSKLSQIFARRKSDPGSDGELPEDLQAVLNDRPDEGDGPVQGMNAAKRIGLMLEDLEATGKVVVIGNEDTEDPAYGLNEVEKEDMTYVGTGRMG